MIERCPACAARAPGEDICRRCGAELRWLARIVRASREQERLAVLSLLQGDIGQASHHVEQAMSCKYSRLQRRLAGFLIGKGARQ